MSERVREWARRLRARIIIVLVILLLVLVALAPLIIVRLEAGELGVRYKLLGGGTEIDYVYQEGVHVIYPWDTMFHYNARVQEIESTVDLLTRNGLPLTFLLTIRYRPEREMLGVLHKEVGPDYARIIVLPQITTVLRQNIGRMTAEDVYTTQRAVLEQMFSEAIEGLAQNYVVVDFIGIRTVTFPKLVQTAIEEKIRERHMADAYEFKLDREQKEARRKGIEAEGFKTFNATVAESLSEEILRWQGILATQAIAESTNSKVIVIGNGDQGLPVILGAGK